MDQRDGGDSQVYEPKGAGTLHGPTISASRTYLLTLVHELNPNLARMVQLSRRMHRRPYPGHCVICASE